jgi:hypothetical protein
MKKLLTMAAIVAAAMVSAKNGGGNQIKKIKNIDILKNKMMTNVLLSNNPIWITVYSPCGKIYFLDANDYTNNNDKLMEDVKQFNAAKCNGDTGFPNISSLE